MRLERILLGVARRPSAGAARGLTQRRLVPATTKDGQAKMRVRGGKKTRRRYARAWEPAK